MVFLLVSLFLYLPLRNKNRKQESSRRPLQKNNNTFASIFFACVTFKNLDTKPVIIMTLQIASLQGAHEGTTCLSYAELTATDGFCLE